MLIAIILFIVVLHLLRDRLFKHGLNGNKMPLIVAGLLLGAIAEELLFRMLLPEYIGYLASGLFFIAVHRPGNLAYLSYLALFTVIITQVYLKMGCPAAIVVHFSANVCVLSLHKMQRS